MINKIAILLAITLMPLFQYGGDPPSRSFNKEAMEEFRADGDFDYSVSYRQSGSIIRDIVQWIFYKLQGFFFGSGNGSVGLNLFRILIAAILILGIVLIVRMKFGGALTSESHINQPVILNEAHTSTNYQQLYHESLASGDLKLTARYLYLTCLQNLQVQGKIKVSIWKTAVDYLNEAPEEYQQVFGDISKAFQASWYGDQPLSRQDLDNLISGAKQLKLA